MIETSVIAQKKRFVTLIKCYKTLLSKIYTFSYQVILFPLGAVFKIYWVILGPSSPPLRKFQSHRNHLKCILNFNSL